MSRLGTRPLVKLNKHAVSFVKFALVKMQKKRENEMCLLSVEKNLL